MNKRIVLSYSGGLDTSVAIKWLMEKGFDVVTLTADVGQQKDLDGAVERARKTGAVKTYLVDCKSEFVTGYVWPSLMANALYEGYPLSSALSRPLICKKLVDVADKEDAEYIAHGCTGKGNDQVRFDLSIGALSPEKKVTAPAREWGLSRGEEAQYALDRGIPIPNPDYLSRYSIDDNLWGRSIEGGALEDPTVEPPGEVYAWTRTISETPDEPQYLDISFEQGIPTAIDGTKTDPVTLVQRLNEVGGRHGVGRIDLIEDRLVGIKSREIYECPGALILIEAHRDLEHLTLSRELLHFKRTIEEKYAQMTYYGEWFDPLMDALSSFIRTSQEYVTGHVTLKLFRGSATVVGRGSPYSLYDYGLATYGQNDAFPKAAKGFIDLWGLSLLVSSRVHQKAKANRAQPRR